MASKGIPGPGSLPSGPLTIDCKPVTGRWAALGEVVTLGRLRGPARRAVAVTSALRVSLLAALLVCAPPVDALANPAQAQMFRAGIVLGQAEARLHFFGQVFGHDLPPDQVGAISTNLTEAANRIELAESLIGTSMTSSRGDHMARLVARIRQLALAPAGLKPYDVSDVTRDYRSGLQYTLDTSRPDAVQWKGTCDSAILDAGYHLGKAITAANISPGDPAMRRTLFADQYQQTAFGMMRQAIYTGLTVAIDGSPPGAPRQPVGGNAEKSCCSFGSQASWLAFLQGLRWNSSAATFDAAGAKRVEVIAATDLPPELCRKKHQWAGLCYKDIVARGHRPVLHVSFPPRGAMDVFKDPAGPEYIGVVGCTHYPFELRAFERDHHVVRDDRPEGTEFSRVVTYRHNTQNNYVSLSQYRREDARPDHTHPWAGLCHRDIVARGYRPIFQFAVDTHVGPVDVFKDPLSNAYVMVPGCNRNEFDMARFQREFAERDTVQHAAGPFFKTTTYRHRDRNSWATLKFYRD